MRRPERIVAPGVPRHIAPQVNRRQRTDLPKTGVPAFLHWRRDWAGRTGLRLWAYSLALLLFLLGGAAPLAAGEPLQEAALPYTLATDQMVCSTDVSSDYAKAIVPSVQAPQRPPRAILVE